MKKIQLKIYIQLFFVILVISFYSCYKDKNALCDEVHNLKPVLTGEDSVPVGAGIYLSTDYYHEGVKFVFFKPDGNYLIEDQNYIAPFAYDTLQSGNYMCYCYTEKGGCESKYDTFHVTVYLQMPPCLTIDNSISFDTIQPSMNFTNIYREIDGSGYNLYAISNTGLIKLKSLKTFYNETSKQTEIAPGVYYLKNPASSIEDEIEIRINSSLGTWVCDSGKVYIYNNQGKITAKFCDVTVHSDSLSVSTNFSGNFIEQ